jgi:hypothetical protein
MDMPIDDDATSNALDSPDYCTNDRDVIEQTLKIDNGGVVPGTKSRYEVATVRRVWAKDPNTGEPYIKVVGESGAEVYKNRSHHGYGYKSHLTEAQKRLIRWALRQRDLGHSRQCVVQALRKGVVERSTGRRIFWHAGPGQFPLSAGTIGSWEITRAAMDLRAKEWPTKKS